MPKCSFKHCKNITSSRTLKKDGISYFRFPRNTTRCAEWTCLLAQQRNEDLFQPKDSSVVCSEHFLKTDVYITEKGKTRLHKTAIPRAMSCNESTTANSEPETAAENTKDLLQKMCRICYSCDRKLYHLEKHALSVMYKQLIGDSQVDVDRCSYVCWECRARLTSFARFRRKAIQAHLQLMGTRDHDHTYSSLQVKIFATNHSDINYIDSGPDPLNHEYVKDTVKNETEDTSDYNYSSSDDETEQTKDFMESETISTTKDNILEDLTSNDFNVILKNETLTHQEIIKNESKTNVTIEVNEILESPEVLNNGVFIVTNDSDTAPKVEPLKETVKNILKPSFTFDEQLLKPASVHLINDQTLEEKFQIEPIMINDGVNKDNKSLKATVKKIRKPKTIQSKKVDRREKPLNCKLNKDIIVTEILSHEEQVMAMLKKRESATYKKSYYKCVDCSKGFSNEEMYTLHMIRHTEQSGAHQCPICKIRFRGKSFVRRHALSHMERYSCKRCSFVTSASGAYQCDICKIRFKSKHLVKNHVVFHMERYRCRRCPYVGCTRHSAKLHEAYHCGIKYQCAHCNESFEHKTSYLSHLRIKHPSGFVCDLCGFSYISRKGLGLHKQLRHRFDEQQVVPEDGPRCMDCNIQFLNVEALFIHLKLCTKRKDLNERVRNERQGLKKRRSTEKWRQGRAEDAAGASGDRAPSAPVACEQCGLQLRNLRAYAHHFRKAHPGLRRTGYNRTLASPVMCEHCGKIFHCKTLLRNHMWVHTGQKQYRCEHCGRAFTQKATMTFHVRAQHSAARPAFQCALCGRRLANRGNRARHMLTHTQRTKSYTCDVCGKGFTTPAEELSHFQHVHQKKPWPKRTGARRRRRQPDPTANETADSGTN